MVNFNNKRKFILIILINQWKKIKRNVSKIKKNLKKTFIFTKNIL